MVAYGIGMVGLIVSACLYLHVAAKYVFVRILRDSKHLQANTMVHWCTWLGCTFGLASISFILAEAIPIFNYLLALTGSICFAPLAITLPAWLWLYDNGHWKRGSIVQKIFYWFHIFLIFLGLFILVAGTYGVVLEIKDAYADGLIGKCFHASDYTTKLTRFQVAPFPARITPTLLRWCFSRGTETRIRYTIHLVMTHSIYQ